MQKPLFSSTLLFRRLPTLLHLLVVFLETICRLLGRSRCGQMRSLGGNRLVSEEKKAVSGFRPALGQRKGSKDANVPQAVYTSDTLALPLGRASPCWGYSMQAFPFPLVLVLFARPGEKDKERISLNFPRKKGLGPRSRHNKNNTISKGWEAFLARFLYAVDLQNIAKSLRKPSDCMLMEWKFHWHEIRIP